MIPKPSIPTPGGQSEPPRPPLVNPPQLGTPKPVVLCPGCRAQLATYHTGRQGAVTVRYHRCGACGATSLVTHQTADGMIVFAGWAESGPCKTRPVQSISTR
jgi:hypothetical protein